MLCLSGQCISSYFNGLYGAHEHILIVLVYTEFPPEHWRRIRSNIGIERIGREIRRRTRVAGTFPDCHSAFMLVA